MAADSAPGALREVARDLWVAERRLRFGGLEVGSRMTVMRLSRGRLAVHSPVRPDPDLTAAVAALGSVDWLIAPNRMHHLSVLAWAEAFPSSEVLVAPGLPEKRPALASSTVLSSELPEGWSGELEALPMAGFPLLEEVVFLHRPSATLVVTDIAFHFGSEDPWLTRWLIGLVGRPGELAPTLLEKLMIRDRAAFRASLDRVLEWPFERVVVSHGAIVEQGGREALARGYEWL